jgi:hypothetical protein
VNLAMTKCHEDKEVYDQRIRQTMGLKPSASMAPRLLTHTMTVVQYMELFAHYRRLEAQFAKSVKEASGADHPAQASASESAATETPTAVPSTADSSSAPATTPGPTVDPTYPQLYQEALGWGANEAEIRHILGHHDLAKARSIL